MTRTYKSQFTSEFIKQMPVKVNFIFCSAYNDDSYDVMDSLAFELKSGSGSNKVWRSDDAYTQSGRLIDLSNGGVAKMIQDYEKLAREEFGVEATVMFGHKNADGSLHADWDWSEVSGSAKHYLAGRRVTPKTHKKPCKVNRMVGATVNRNFGKLF